MMGMLSTRSCPSAQLAAEPICSLPISVPCQGKASSAEVFWFSLLPASMALVPVLLQLGERRLGRTSGS